MDAPTTSHTEPTEPKGGSHALSVALRWLDAPGRLESISTRAAPPLDPVPSSTSLSESLRDAGLDDWSAAVGAGIEDGTHSGAEKRWLLSRLAISLATKPTHPHGFMAVGIFQLLSSLSDEALVVALEEQGGARDSALALLGVLRVRLHVRWESRYFKREREYFETNVRQPLTTRQIWPPPVFFTVGDNWAHRLVASACPSEYMALIAEFPAVFQHAVEPPLLAPDLLLARSLVQGCPRIYDSDGRPLGPVFVFALLQTVESELEREGGIEAPGLVALLDALFARADGQWLARAWLQQTISNDAPRRAGRPNAELDRRQDVRRLLVERLSERIAPLTNGIYSWIEREEPLWRVDRVLTEACIFAVRNDGVAAEVVLREAVLGGMVSATGRTRVLRERSFEGAIVAAAVRDLPSGADWFRSFWLATYEVRERRSYPAHRELENPAYPVLYWGLAALVWDGSPTDRSGLWIELVAATLETQLIDPNAWLFNGPMPPLVQALVQTGAEFLKRGELDAKSFASFMKDQLEPTAEYASLWLMIRERLADDVSLELGREVGASLLQQALQGAMSLQPIKYGSAAFEPSKESDLKMFASRL